MALPDPWHDFALDPRREEHAPLRAADADRDVVLGVLAEAYAQGRLNRDEYDERSARAQHIRTLAEVPALIDDLVAPTYTSAVPAVAGAGASPPSVRAQAVQRWERDRREALLGFLIPTLITWVIWSVVMPGGFPWPAIVTVATAAPLLRVVIGRSDILARHEQKILDKQARRARREIELGRKPPELPGPEA